MDSKPKTHKQDHLVISQTRNGSEWSPGEPKKSKDKFLVPQPVRSTVQVIEDILMHWFLNEQPKADDVQVVPNSLQLIDVQHNIWRAKVQTYVYYKTIETRIHESSVRFRVESKLDKNNPKVLRNSIYHNHLIFPS